MRFFCFVLTNSSTHLSWIAMYIADYYFQFPDFDALLCWTPYHVDLLLFFFVVYSSWILSTSQNSNILRIFKDILRILWAFWNRPHRSIFIFGHMKFCWNETFLIADYGQVARYLHKLMYIVKIFIIFLISCAQVKFY